MEKDLLDMLPVMESGTGGCGCTDAPADGCVGHEGCGEGSLGLAGYPLAMVYAPCQTFASLYEPSMALSRGTMFCELDLPLGCCAKASCSIEPRD